MTDEERITACLMAIVVSTVIVTMAIGLVAVLAHFDVIGVAQSYHEQPDGLLPPDRRRFGLMICGVIGGLLISCWGSSRLYEKPNVAASIAIVVCGLMVAWCGCGVLALLLWPSTWGWPI